MAKENKDFLDFKNVEMKMPEDSFLATDETTKTIPVLPFILVGVILLLVGILGGILWWGSEILNSRENTSVTTNIQRPTKEENNEPESNNAEADVQIIKTFSTSDEISPIEADISATEIENLDKELQVIDKELNDLR